jgi:aryl-alcohol dehydrogenase-like predicted oxidoreductase
MRYVKLGNTGLDISPIALGCMTFGEPSRGYPTWTLPEDESRPLIRQAIEAGINFFDTANAYSEGSSEEILGRALKDFADRDEAVVATKARHAMRPGPNGSGLSRGCCGTRSSPPPSSAREGPHIWTTPSRRRTSSCPTARWLSWRQGTRHTPSLRAA